MNNGKVFPKSANEPNEMALAISNLFSRYWFRLMRDWKLGNSPNGKEIFIVPFRKEKRGLPLEVVYNFQTAGIFWKITVPFEFSG